jgi:hypothetical protein
MIEYRIQALGPDFFDILVKDFEKENIKYKIKKNLFLKEGFYHFKGFESSTHPEVENKDFYAIFGLNENRFAISQIVDMYFTNETKKYRFPNIPKPHVGIDYEFINGGFYMTIVDKINSYTINETSILSRLKQPTKSLIFSTLIVNLESIFNNGTFIEILRNNKIIGEVCYPKNLNSTLYYGIGTIGNQKVYFNYNCDENSRLFLELSRAYFYEVHEYKATNLQNNNYFCMGYNNGLDKSIREFHNILKKSNTKVVLIK